MKQIYKYSSKQKIVKNKTKERLRFCVIANFTLKWCKTVMIVLCFWKESFVNLISLNINCCNDVRVSFFTIILVTGLTCVIIIGQWYFRNVLNLYSTIIIMVISEHSLWFYMIIYVHYFHETNKIQTLIWTQSN